MVKSLSKMIPCPLVIFVLLDFFLSLSPQDGSRNDINGSSSILLVFILLDKRVSTSWSVVQFRIFVSGLSFIEVTLV